MKYLNKLEKRETKFETSKQCFFYLGGNNN